MSLNFITARDTTQQLVFTVKQFLFPESATSIQRAFRIKLHVLVLLLNLSIGVSRTFGLLRTGNISPRKSIEGLLTVETEPNANS